MMPDIKFEFHAPLNEKQSLETIYTELGKIPKEYKDVFCPSVTKKLGKLFSSAQTKKSEWQKKELESKLKILKNESVRIFSTYYEDKDIRSKGEACINTIDEYCKKAAIKKMVTKAYPSVALSIKDSLRGVEFFIHKINDNKKRLEEAHARIVQEDDFRNIAEKIKEDYKIFTADKIEANTQGIDTTEYNSLITKLNAVVSEKTKMNKAAERKNIEEKLAKYNEYNKCNTKFIRLTTTLKSANPDWDKISKDLRKLLKDLEKLSKELSGAPRTVAAVAFDEKENLEGLQAELKASIKELKRKIDFAKKLETYKVFDNNKGLGISFSYKSEMEQKAEVQRIWDGGWVSGWKSNPKYFLKGSQECLPIAKGEKIEVQFNHASGDFVTGHKGPYYIIVNSKSEQVKGTLTLYSEEKMKDYLKKALQAGTFEKITV